MIEKDFLHSLFEAPGDDEGGNDNNVDLAANDNNDQNNADNNANDDNAGDQDNADQNADNNQQNNNQNDQVNDDNFDIDDNTDDNPPEDEGNDTPANNNTNNGDEAGSENDITDEEKEENNEIDKIYDGLSPLEKQRMDVALRDQYKELYYDIATLIQDTEKFPNTLDTREFADRLLLNLRNFKKYIVYYLSNIYDTKAHLENKVTYMQFIQIYRGIKSVYDDIKDGISHLNNTDEKK